MRVGTGQVASDPVYVRMHLSRRGSPPRSMLVGIAIALVVVGTASGGGGKQSPGKQPPVNTSPPTVAGTTEVGQALTGSPGSWSGPGAAFGYQWLR